MLRGDRVPHHGQICADHAVGTVQGHPAATVECVTSVGGEKYGLALRFEAVGGSFRTLWRTVRDAVLKPKHLRGGEVPGLYVTRRNVTILTNYA